MATTVVCSEVLGILARPELSDDAALRRARVHAASCPHCAGVLDDGVEPLATSLKASLPAVSMRLRTILAIVAGAQLLISIPWLFGVNPLGDLGDHVDVSHLTRDGALGLATAIAGLLTAWRPRYAVPAVAVSATALVAQVAMALVDDHAHRVNLAFEGIHLVTVAVTALVAIHSKQTTLAPTKSPSRLRSLD